MTSLHALDSQPGFLDRIAVRALPPLATLGAPGTIVAPLLMISLLSVVSAAATQAWGLDLLAPGDVELPFDVATLIWVLAALSPVVAFGKAMAFGAVAWAVLALIGAQATLRSTISALMFGEVLMALQGLVTLATLVLQGGPRSGSVPVITGLNAFATQGGAVWVAIASTVTPLRVIWVVFLGLAFASCGRTDRLRGLTTAASLWVFLAGLAILRALVAQGAS